MQSTEYNSVRQRSSMKCNGTEPGAPVGVWQQLYEGQIKKTCGLIGVVVVVVVVVAAAAAVVECSSSSSSRGYRRKCPFTLGIVPIPYAKEIRR